MKTMIINNKKSLHICLIFRQSLCTILVCLSFTLSAAEITKNISNNPRKPAAVDEEVLTIPLKLDEGFFTNDNMFAEDDAGVMKDIKSSMNGWDEREEYAHRWNLEQTGLYEIPTTTQKTKYLSKKMLKYADKRLSGEMKKAGEGSTLYSINRVEKSLRPNAAVNVSKNFSIKFKARVLQGKAIVDLKNPWVECNATLSANGKAKVLTRKEFKEMGMASGAEYSVNDYSLLTYIDQQVTENVKARVSNTNGVNTDSKIELMASFPFNL